MPVPTEITEDREAKQLRIAWSDGHASRYAFRRLRQACPCAMCVHEWTGEHLLDPKRVPVDIRPREIARVGAYALRFTWSDGHMTGIYTFPLLRNICECEACSTARAPLPRD